MENASNTTVVVPTSYFEMLQFILNNKEMILKDWGLLFDILRRLDSMLKSATTMADLRKDTSIMLQAIKLEQDALFREITNEVTLEKIMSISNEKVLEDFFMQLKATSLTMEFVDRLTLNYTLKPQAPRAERTRNTDDPESEQSLSEIDETTKLHEVSRVLQEIRTRVESKGSVEFFELVMDVDSYSKTVSNAFNLALALRMKLVSLKMENGALQATPYDNTNEELGHCVFEITPEQHEKFREGG